MLLVIVSQNYPLSGEVQHYKPNIHLKCSPKYKLSRISPQIPNCQLCGLTCAGEEVCGVMYLVLQSDRVARHCVNYQLCLIEGMVI